MARPRLVTRIDQIAAEMLPLIDELSRLACPECTRFTLYPEITMRSGVVIRCEGLSRHSETGECGFQAFALLSSERELPRTDLTGVDPG